MQYEIIDNKLVFHLAGELNSYNSEATEKEMDQVIAKGGFETIVWDIKDLKYMSSAGLRIVAKQKQTYDDLSLINMADDIYDVFEMVGFANLINIERKK